VDICARLFGVGQRSGPLVAVAPPPARRRLNPGTRFVCTASHAFDFHQLYERDWLMELLGDLKTVEVERATAAAPPPTSSPPPIVILQRPFVAECTAMLRAWSDAGATFRIIHVSDEFATDALDAYALPGCVSVLRTYLREDLPAGTESKVHIIPLGYHWTSAAPATPRLPFRHTIWSFFGTNWNNRKQLLEPLIAATSLPNKHAFYDTWADPSGLQKEEYLSALLDTVFVPCPDGNNPETFRFYEALQAGCIPLVVKTVENETWFRWVSERIPIVPLASWSEAPRIILTLMSRPEMLETYRETILRGWAAWRAELREQGRRWMDGETVAAPSA
jgi:Exostosin family